ncbi:hypothetical protein [Microvirga roseola]|uniref:hypothetical protein n=1 Tax=Microvirga roseola TaxID=2883126 RepID=UPI001E4BF0C9|nr:hypothetical protein [Microvirga roseola]
MKRTIPAGLPFTIDSFAIMLLQRQGQSDRWKMHTFLAFLRGHELSAPRTISAGGSEPLPSKCSSLSRLWACSI